jgi:uncharacterized protein (TIGR00730 family)
MPKRVCIFCGANAGNDPLIHEQTQVLSSLLIERGYDLVYGGGRTGLMGQIADHFLNAGRKVIGVRPEKLIFDEDIHTQLTEAVVVPDMASRKQQMLSLADSFIALPGGVGTLDEILEVYTLLKIGYSSKPCGLLNTNGYYHHLEQLLLHMVARGFLGEADRQRLIFAAEPQSLLHELGI